MIIQRLSLGILLLVLLIGLAACNGGPRNVAAAPPPAQAPPAKSPSRLLDATLPADYTINSQGTSNVEQAHEQLLSQGNKVYLVIVSSQSTGLEGEIYADLRQRNFRATAGLDEGIDTRGEFCFPDCVFVPAEEVDAIGVDAWLRVLQHEYRHITQARNNANMAQDFKSNGQFTYYAAFSEACADYGLNVAPVYQAQMRVDQLKSTLGSDQQNLIDQACSGDKSAYQMVVDQYNQKAGQDNAFQTLFPPYQ